MHKVKGNTESNSKETLKKNSTNKSTAKLFIVDQRMLELMKYAISVTLKGVKTQNDFCDAIGILKMGIAPIRNGQRGFTTSQIHNAIKHFGVDANWIFGVSEIMFVEKPKTALQLLKEATIAVEAAYGPKINTEARAYKKKSAKQ